MRTSIYHKSRSVVALTSAARNNTGTPFAGATVDRYQAGVVEYRTLMFVISTATVTDGSHVFTVQDSDDGTSWGTPNAGDVQGTAPTITSTNSNAVFDVGYNGAKRYARLQVAVSGATTGGVYSAAAVLYGTRRDR
jgi:hypothetical protein